MNSPKNRYGSRVFAFLLALGVLIFTVGLVGLMIRLRPEPDIRAPAQITAQRVNALELTRSSNPVIVEVYGTAQAAKTLRLQAPITGTAVASSDLFEGKRIDANETLFQIDTIRQDLSIQDLRVKLKELAIKKSQLEAEGLILAQRMQTARELLQNSSEAVTQQESLLNIQKQLFTNFQELYERETISYTEYLNRESALREAELSVLQAETTRNSRKDALDQLQLEVEQNSKALANIDNERQVFEIQIAQLEDDRSKAKISTDFASQIVELFIEKEQEVTAGSTLAILRSTNKSQVEVDIPDSYFRWLYSGDFLDQIEDPSSNLISIHLVLGNFEKQFDGGYLKAIGDSVNIPTRSLPILIERVNPTNEQGQAIPKEELKPGMYCKVRLLLASVENSFLVPYRAIQADGSLIIAQQTPKQNLFSFAVIKDVELVHEGLDGAIVKLSQDIDKIVLVTDQMRAVDVGAPVFPVFGNASEDTDKQ